MFDQVNPIQIADPTTNKATNKRLFTAGWTRGKDTKISPFTGAQVALINEDTWSVIGPNKRITGLIGALDLNELTRTITCPIVITTRIKHRSVVERVLRAYVTIEGLRDMDGFIAKMELLGGNVVYPGEFSSASVFNASAFN